MTIIEIPFKDKDIPIGTEFIVNRPKYTRRMKVIDILKTFDYLGKLKKTAYVCRGPFSIDYDVCKVTIQRALMAEGEKK